jgi:hypothetical protein
MYESAYNLRIPLVLGAVLYLSAGIGGIVAVRRHDE